MRAAPVISMAFALHFSAVTAIRRNNCGVTNPQVCAELRQRFRCRAGKWRLSFRFQQRRPPCHRSTHNECSLEHPQFRRQYRKTALAISRRGRRRRLTSVNRFMEPVIWFSKVWKNRNLEFRLILFTSRQFSSRSCKYYDAKSTGYFTSDDSEQPASTEKVNGAFGNLGP